MAFTEGNVLALNQVSGGRSGSPTVYSINYNGPIADWTTTVDVALKAYLVKVGAGISDFVALRARDDDDDAPTFGVISEIDATKLGLAVATTTAPT